MRIDGGSITPVTKLGIALGLYCLDKCSLCESLGAPAAHRMGGTACCSSKKGNKRKPSIRDSAAKKIIADPVCTEEGTRCAVDGRKEAMDLVQ